MNKGLAVILSVVVANWSFGQGVFTAATGTVDWTNSSHWTLDSGSDSDGIPDSDDDVNIGSGTHIRIDGTTEACDDLNITAGASFAKVEIKTSGQLTVGGTLTITDGASSQVASLVVSGSTATAIVSGDISMSATVNANNKVDLSGSSATLKIAGAFSFPSGSGTLSTTSGSTVEFNGSAAQTIPASNSNFVFDNITSRNTHTDGLTTNAALTGTNLTGDFSVATGAKFNDGGYAIAVAGDLSVVGTYVASGSIDVEGNMSITGGTFTSSGCDISLAGNWSMSGGGKYTYNSGDEVTFDGTSGTNTITGATSWSKLKINHTGTGVQVSSGAQQIYTWLDIDQGDFDANSNAVTLKSDADGTGLLLDIGSGTYTGDLTVERYIACAEQGYREMASPVSGTTLNDWKSNGVVFAGFTGSDYPNFWGGSNAWRYDESGCGGNADNGWVSATNITNEVTNTTPYRVYLDASNYTISTSGAPKTGSQVINLTNSGASPSTDENYGWALIGNPYPCTLDWDAISAGDKSNVEDGIWIWSASAGNYGSYAKGFGSGSNGVTNEIASSQAFWVHCDGATGSVTINEEDKTSTDKAFVKASNSQNFLKIKLAGDVNGYFDEMLVRTHPDGTEAFDEGLEFEKLYSPLVMDAPSIAAVSSDGKDITLSSIAELGSVDMPIKAFAGSASHGLYHFEFSIENDFMPGACLTIEDLQTGDVTDIRSNNEYFFTTSSTDVQPRFILHVQRDFDVVSENPTCSNTNDGKIVVEAQANGTFFNLLEPNGNAVATGVFSGTPLEFVNLSGGEYTVSTSSIGTCGTNNELVLISSPQEVVASFEFAEDTLVLGVQNEVQLIDFSQGGTNYHWDFGNGEESDVEDPLVTYNEIGIYPVTLTVDNDNIGACSHSVTRNMVVTQVLTSVEEYDFQFNIFNSNGEIVLDIESKNASTIIFQLYDMNGKKVMDEDMGVLGEGRYYIEHYDYGSGVYLVHITVNGHVHSSKVYLY